MLLIQRSLKQNGLKKGDVWVGKGGVVGKGEVWLEKGVLCDCSIFVIIVTLY